MEEEVFKEEKEKLKIVVEQLKKEEEEIDERLKSTSHSYEKEDSVRAHLIYLGEKKRKDIQAISDKPYFARLDFKEEQMPIEKLYIGKLSILDSQTQKPIVVDWRAPIANLYYDGRIGTSSYSCLDTVIEGEILLKRQFFIEEQELKKYVNMDLTTNDELLQEALEEKAEDRLKNIVATIQKEQNAIIRAPMGKPLIIQGVAGSGKTTIALHRIAYLIYQNEQHFNPEDFMILAPNKFFLDYISNILPDLGVENVRQYTFEDFAYEILGKRLKIADSNEKLVKIVNKEFDEINQGNVDLMIQESKFKSSLKFKEKVEQYLKKVEKDYIPKIDFEIEGNLIFKTEELQKMFLEMYAMYPFEKRIEEIKKHVRLELKKKAEEIIQTIENKRSIQIRQLEEKKLEITKEREERIKIFEKTEKILQTLQKNQKKLVEEYFKQISRKEALEHYRKLVEELPEDTPLNCYLKTNTLANLKNKEVSFEDMAPILFIHNQIQGAKFSGKLQHIIIDEAQDYGEFQFAMLKTILNSNSMTILGDIAQGVHFYRGIENWEEFIKAEFPEEKVSYTTLSKTYRTTKEIMEKANQVIRKLSEEESSIILADPIVDRKNCVYSKQEQTMQEVVRDIDQRINFHLEQHYQTIAIIGKDKKECEQLKKELDKLRKDIHLIESKDSNYLGGISIVPSYLAKGLEFDVVILANASKEQYQETTLDRKLLYVAITRAMSKLDIFSIGPLTNLLLTA